MTSSEPCRPALLVFADSLAYYGPQGGRPPMTADLAQYRCWRTGLGSGTDRPDRVDLPRRVVGRHPGSAGLGGPAAGGCRHLRHQRDGLAALPAAHRDAGGDALHPAAAAAPLGARRLYGWLQPRLSPVSRSALPPRLSVDYLEMTRGAIDFNRPGIPIVAALPSVHRADTYGRAHHGREPTASAITEWAARYGIPLVDLKAAVAGEILAGRGQSGRHPLELRGARGGRGADAQGAGRRRRPAG